MEENNEKQDQKIKIKYEVPQHDDKPKLNQSGS